MNYTVYEYIRESIISKFLSLKQFLCDVKIWAAPLNSLSDL